MTVFHRPVSYLYSSSNVSAFLHPVHLMSVCLLCYSMFGNTSNASMSSMFNNAGPFPGTTKCAQFMFL